MIDLDEVFCDLVFASLIPLIILVRLVMCYKSKKVDAPCKVCPKCQTFKDLWKFLKKLSLS